jgi:hypothetical protein
MDSCKHEIDEETMKYDPIHGRIGVCKHCGTKLAYTRFCEPNPKKPPKHHMSKKERKRHKEALRNE